MSVWALILFRVVAAALGLVALTILLTSCGAPPDRTDWAGISQAIKEQRR